MSIIHQALKKAAAEGQVSHASSTLIKGTSARPFPLKSAIISLLALALFFSLIFLGSLRPSLRSFFKIEQANKAENTLIAPKKTSDSTLIASSPKKQFQSKSDVEPSQQGEAALAEGVVFYRQGKMELAKERFTVAVSLLPLSAVAHNNLGLVLRNQGKIEEAIRHYQEGIGLDSNYAEAHNNLGMAYDQLGSIDQASIYYQKAIRFKPAVPEFHLNYATWLERKGDFSKARQEYQAYLSLESKAVSDGKATSQQKESIALVKARLMELKGFN